MAEELLNEQLIRYADREKFSAVAGSGQIVATACLACAYSEMTQANMGNVPLQPLLLLERVTTLAVGSEPPLKCSDGQDMKAVQHASLYNAGPETPVTQICSRFVLRPMPPQTAQAK